MNKKKLLALLMALVMTLTLVPVTALAEGETLYGTVTVNGATTEFYRENYVDDEAVMDAIAAVVEGKTSSDTISITLEHDFVIPNFTGIYGSNEELTIGDDTRYAYYDNRPTVIFDLNGHKIHYTHSAYANGAFRIFNCDMVLKDTCGGGSIISDGYLWGVMHQGNCIITVEGGTLASYSSTFGGDLGVGLGTAGDSVWSADAENTSGSDRFVPGQIVIKGGTIVGMDDPAIWKDYIEAVPEGYEYGFTTYKNNKAFTVTAPAPTYVAQIGEEQQFETLEEAFANAQDGATIILQTDCIMASNVEINKNITLDLNGKAITSNQDDLFTVKESGTLTINDSAGGGSIYTSQWTVLIADGGNIIVNAGKITAKNANTAYTSGNGSITFNGGMINQPDTYYSIGDGRVSYAGYGENAGYYIIAVPTVTAVTPNAVEYASGITGQQRQFDATAVENTTLVWTSSDTNVATVSENGLVTIVGDGTATIYAADAATGSYAYATVTVGNANYKTLANNNTYASLQVAVNEAASEDTIQVLNNVTLSAVTTFPADKTLTLNLDGHTITENSNDACLLKNNGTLTITGGTIRNGNSETNLNNSKGLVENHGTLTVSGAFYDYGQGYGGTLLNLGGSLTVKTGTEIQGYGKGSGNATINSKADLVIEDGVTLENRSTDEIVTGGYGIYCVSIAGGEATIGTLGATNPTTVTGYRGAVGINGGKLTIHSGTFTGTKYRDLWITNDGDNTSVTINGGTFSGSVESIRAAVDDGRQDASNVALTINGGYFNKGVVRGTTLTQKQWNIAIKGGFYKVAPNDKLVAEGYAKASLTSGDEYGAGYLYQVGKVKTSEPTVSGEASIETQIANNQIKYTVTTDVVDDKNEDELIQNIKTAQALTVSGTTTINYSDVDTASTDTSSVGAVALEQLDKDKIGEIVQAAVNSAGVDAGDANSIAVVLVSDGGTTNAQTNPTKITYEVHPEAIVYKTENDSETAIGSYAISNDELGDTTFTFKLAVGTLASAGGKVNVTHKHNGTSENLGAFTVDDDRNITITGIKSFSEFELVSVGDVTATCQGASLRRRVLTKDHNTVVNTSTDYRVTFDWTDSSGNTVDVSKSKLQWSNDGGHSWHTVAINNMGTVSGATRASVVITGIPSGAFSTTINTRLCLKNSSGDEILTVNGPSYSVRDVADKLSKLTGDDNAQWRDYGDWLLGNRTVPLYIVNN